MFNYKESERFFSKVEKTSDCWLWIAGRNCYGYGVFFFRGRLLGAHRVSYYNAFGEIPKGLCVLHKCDIRHCVNPEHFFLGTNADNTRDMVKKGRQAKGENSSFRKNRSHYPMGEKHPHAKLTENNVREIRRRWFPPDENYSSLGREFGVYPNAIKQIIMGDTWKEVSD